MFLRAIAVFLTFSVLLAEGEGSQALNALGYWEWDINRKEMRSPDESFSCRHQDQNLFGDDFIYIDLKNIRTTRRLFETKITENDLKARTFLEKFEDLVRQVEGIYQPLQGRQYEQLAILAQQVNELAKNQPRSINGLMNENEPVFLAQMSVNNWPQFYTSQKQKLLDLLTSFMQRLYDPA